jgi:hypothetical protein
MKFIHLKTSLFLAASVFIFSCNKDTLAPPTLDTTVNLTATLNGANEVPANSSTATGTATALYDKSSKVLTLTVSYSGMTATNMHIHKGPAGVSGNVIFPLGARPYSSATTYTTPALTLGQEDSLMNKLYYVNIHSAAPYQAGEIRGQLVVNP